MVLAMTSAPTKLTLRSRRHQRLPIIASINLLRWNGDAKTINLTSPLVILLVVRTNSEPLQKADGLPYWHPPCPQGEARDTQHASHHG